MGKLLIFGGTTEGRQASAQAALQGHQVTVCVTSAYARALLPLDMDCRVGMLDEASMLAFIKEQRPSCIIDATHPFATRATATIRSCAQQLSLPYKRIERPVQDALIWRHDVQWAQDATAAAHALSLTQGNILLTTGSHTIGTYTAQIDPKRLYVRVLPTVQALNLCLSAGVLPSHIMAMHGPFSQALNAAVYDQLDIRVMVSKDSGAAGGVEEKVIPALARDIQVILIKRPEENQYAR